MNTTRQKLRQRFVADTAAKFFAAKLQGYWACPNRPIHSTPPGIIDSTSAAIDLADELERRQEAPWLTT